MPKISNSEPATENPKADKPARKVKSKAVAEKPILYPEIVVSVCRGDTALTISKIKELLGWTDENVTGEDYHLVDRNDKKIRLANSTHNRPFYMVLGNKYAQEHLNKRWRVNGEPRVVGKRGEVLSGQHSMAGAVLADQDRERNPHWEENWPGEVTMETVLVLGIDETDEVVNTLDTGKPRSIGDTLYRSHHFADLPPKQRKTASKVCGFAIKMLWARTGANRDAFSSIPTHGAFLQFLDDHPTLTKCVRHIIEEDAAGAVSAVLSPGYSAAMMYLMTVSKTDPAQYVVKAKEGTRGEKYLDKSMFARAEEFWMMVGKLETPDLRAVRDRLKTYAKREDKDGLPIPVSLAEKMAVITLAWITYADGSVPTLADVTPKFHAAKDDHSQPLLKDPPSLGGIDLGEEEDEEEDDAEDNDEQDPVEKLREDLASTREERSAAAVEQRKKEIKEEKAGKKKAMSEASPAGTNGKPLSIAEEVREQYAKTIVGHEGKILFFKSRTSGALTCIDADAKKAAKIVGQKVTESDGLTRFTVSKAEVEATLKKLLKIKGVKVAIAEEVPVAGVKEKMTKVTDYIDK